MVKPQAAASGKAGMDCTGEYNQPPRETAARIGKAADHKLDGTTRAGGCTHKKISRYVSRETVLRIAPAVEIVSTATSQHEG